MDKGLSIVIPVYNEENNIGVLIDEICKVLSDYFTELLIVDDGSTDNTKSIVKQKLKDYSGIDNVKIRLIELRRNSGQTAAMKAGFDLASQPYVVSMDGDGQNDPADIPKMLKSLIDNRADVICGWRKHRKDSIGKRVSSRLSNFIRRMITGLSIHDSGCTLRVYVREAVKDLTIWGEDHRYIPQIIHSKGFKVIEKVVNHRSRISGSSKYGISRLYRGGLDLLSITFVSRLAKKPLHFFTLVSLPFLISGTFILSYLSYIRLVFNSPIADRPLLLMGVLLEIFGFQIFLSGLTNELTTSIKMRDESNYSIREIFD